MNKLVFLILSLGILLLGACAAPQENGEPEAPSPAAEPAEQPREATDVPEPTTASDPTESPAEPTVAASMPFELTSTAFARGEPIPVQYSCDGEDISPSLAWGDPPEGTQSLALIMDDPDAPVGTWDHWIVFDIPVDVRELPEGVSAGGVNASSGQNSWGRGDYGGPCPPGGTHRYFFKLYALDISLSLDGNANKGQVLDAMEGHILAEAELMGTYSR